MGVGEESATAVDPDSSSKRSIPGEIKKPRRATTPPMMVQISACFLRLFAVHQPANLRLQRPFFELVNTSTPSSSITDLTGEGHNLRKGDAYWQICVNCPSCTNCGDSAFM